uniref:Uncharacterized protein n=1 Tax=Micrurus lemniscatus lemniscatus TaxID=129467 RepID=A0A2D4IGQ2_MICLE
MMVKTHKLIARNHDDMKLEMRTEIGGVKNEIQNLNSKIGKMQEVLTKNEQKLNTVEARIEVVEKRLEETEQNWKVLYCELRDSMVHIELEKASFYLRFQNVVEDRKEDLRVVMVNLIATALQKNKQEIENDIDEVYRVYTRYTQRNSLPRELYITTGKALCPVLKMKAGTCSLPNLTR